MRICIDCFNLVKGKGKSIGIYNLAITTVQAIRDNLRPADELYVFGNKYNSVDFDIERVNFIEVNIDPYKLQDMVLWENILVNKYIDRYSIEAILFPRGYAPLFKKSNCRYIVTINDMIPMYYHEKICKDYTLRSVYIRRKLIFSARKADGIITISNYSKKDIVKYAGVSDEKIKVIYCSLNDVSCLSCGSTGDYISAITSKLEHKNARGIIEAYKRYFEKSEDPLPIKIIGIDKKSVEHLVVNVDKNVLNNIEFCGYLKSNQEHYTIIQNSKFFMFLSLTEGFGFPPIEAMQLGVPVLCSDAGSLKEIIKDSGILVDPYNIEDISKKMIELDTNEELREKLIDLGKQNVLRFNSINHGLEYLEYLDGKDEKIR